MPQTKPGNSEAPPKNQLEDFEAFLEPDFQPGLFANDLLLATNGSDSPELDLITPIKKLQFDIQECDKRMKEIAGGNFEALVTNFSRIEAAKSLLGDRINPGIDQVNSSFQRVKTGVLQPYDEAVRLNRALKRIHTTLDLLRGSSYFVFLLQQLDELEKAFADTDSNKTLVRLAKLHLQINRFYEGEEKAKSKNAPSLLSIKLIRDSHATITNKRVTLQTQCVHFLTHEFGHKNAFHSDPIALQNHIVALYILNPTEFYSVLERSTLTRLVQESANQLSRALQSPRNFTAIMSEIKEGNEDYLEKLTTVLTGSEVPEANSNRSLIGLVLEKFNIQSLQSEFWSRLAEKFKKNVAATMARGGPIAKNLKIYSTGIRNSLKETFKGELERRLLLDAVSIIE